MGVVWQQIVHVPGPPPPRTWSRASRKQRLTPSNFTTAAIWYCDVVSKLKKILGVFRYCKKLKDFQLTILDRWVLGCDAPCWPCGLPRHQGQKWKKSHWAAMSQSLATLVEGCSMGLGWTVTALKEDYALFTYFVGRQRTCDVNRAAIAAGQSH